mgnify:CR=1 FL=1
MGGVPSNELACVCCPLCAGNGEWFGDALREEADCRKVEGEGSDLFLCGST